MTPRSFGAAQDRVRLTSRYTPATRTVNIAIGTDTGLRPGTRIGLTSQLQLAARDDAVEVVGLVGTYHEIVLLDGVLAGVVADFDFEAVSHRPRHANDGPRSAFVIGAGGDVDEIDVAPMALTAEPVTLLPAPRQVTIDAPRRRRCRMVSDDSEHGRRWAAYARLGHRLGHLSDPDSVDDVPVVTVELRLDPALGTRGAYQVDVSSDRATVAAGDATGLGYGCATLAQLASGGLPERATVHDWPRYSWRGLHIDLARGWFEPEVVLDLIDDAAWRKLSRVHLHLTDDEAWRLPVPGRPELAEIGGTRGYGLPLPPFQGSGGAPFGRAYTVDEIGAWVARADALGVVLVPEVDLPGHNLAALTALPELRDPDDTSNVESVQHYLDNALVPGHPATLPFVREVLTAVAELFPSSPWIHIGGDEVPDGAWSGSPLAQRYAASIGATTSRELEAAFHREVIGIIRNELGRRVGAWEEAAEAGGLTVDDGYVVAWRSVEASRALVARGFDVVAAPGQAYYLDMAADGAWESRGTAWAPPASFDVACGHDPAAGWSPSERSHLLGVQACLWTELVPDADVLRRFLFPRLDAVAERGWSGDIIGGPVSLLARGTAVARIG